MIIDTTKFNFWTFDRPIKSYYANTLELEATPYADLKLRGHLEEKEIFKRIKGRPFFSTHDNIGKGDMLKVLQILFPLPSPYERD